VTYHCTVAFNGGDVDHAGGGSDYLEAGQTLKAQLEIYDFHSISTPYRRGGGLVEGANQRECRRRPAPTIVRRAGGVPYYEYAIRTVKGQLRDDADHGELQRSRDPVLSKSLTLVN